jgi:hypothetical protein
MAVGHDSHTSIFFFVVSVAQLPGRVGDLKRRQGQEPSVELVAQGRAVGQRVQLQEQKVCPKQVVILVELCAKESVPQRRPQLVPPRQHSAGARLAVWRDVAVLEQAAPRALVREELVPDDGAVQQRSILHDVVHAGSARGGVPALQAARKDGRGVERVVAPPHPQLAVERRVHEANLAAGRVRRGVVAGGGARRGVVGGHRGVTCQGEWNPENDDPLMLNGRRPATRSRVPSPHPYRRPRLPCGNKFYF